MSTLLWLTVLIPAAVAVLAVRLPSAVARPLAATGAAVAAVPAWALLIAAVDGERTTSVLSWLRADGFEVGFRLDALSAVMTATVATVGLVVVVYATGYFAGHDRAPSALAGLLAFLAAMQGLVLADGFLTLLVFWELVGALSARLIAFSREDASAPGGAVRAFLTTRAADTGLYLAVFALFAAHGTLDFGTARPDGALGALVGLGLVVAAMGKSAQAPLHTWLAGAMAGPTPVSALLHSATMVAAGVYLLARNADLLAGWPLEVAGWVGALTAVAGALIALAQDDLKRVLAGSTTSQLGLMFVAVAAGGPIVAIFHLVAHAAGKAALFLGAGVFEHNRRSTRLDDLRGAGRDDRPAMTAFAIGAASIAGVPPLAAFWSKDAIVASAEGHVAWIVLALAAAAGSAAYLLRPALILWRAGGARRVPARRGRRTMLGGAAVLGAASLAGATLAFPLEALLDQRLPAISALSVALSVAAVLAGAGAVLKGARPPARARVVARRQLFANEALGAVAVRPALLLARTADAFDRLLLDAAVDGLARTGVRVAALLRRVEDGGIDAAVDGLARSVGRSGDGLRRLQSGRLYEYLRDTVVGAAAVAALIALTALT